MEEPTKETDTTFESAWNFETRLLLFTGFYPKENKTIFYWLRLTLTTFFSLGQLIAMLIQTTQETDLNKIIDILYFCMTQTAYLCKLFNFLAMRSGFRQIELFAKKLIFNRQTEEQNYLIKSEVTRCVKIAKFYRGLCLLVISLMTLYPIVDSANEKQLPLTGWYPLDKEKYYLVIYIFQAIALWISAAMNSCFDTLPCACICVGSVQFDILMDNFRIELSDTNRNHNSAKDSLNVRIKENVIHHNEIFKYIECIEDTFSNGIFVQFLASIIVICMTGFQMLVVTPFSVQFFSLFSYFSCMMNQVALYCWYGHDILVKGSNVGSACYMADWHKYSIENQKSLFIVMERSKRPVKLTAGKFFTLSLGTLTMILRSSYSYFAVLRHLYSKNEVLQH